MWVSPSFRAEPLEARRLFDAGWLDTQFNGTGAVVTDFPGVHEYGQTVLPMLDGRALVVGGYRVPDTVPGSPRAGYVFARYDPDGSLDDTFGSGGTVRVPAPAGENPTSYVHVSDALLQPDGKIIVVGSRVPSAQQANQLFDKALVLARFNADGSFDTTFGTGGVVETDDITSADGNWGVRLLPDGQIIVAGTFYEGNQGDFSTDTYRVTSIRFTATGQFDFTYAGSHGVRSETGDFLRVVALLPAPGGNTYVVAEGIFANFIYVGLTTADGERVEGFGDFSSVRIGELHGGTHWADAALAPDGDIVLAGSAGGQFRVARLRNGNEELDPTFGADADGDGYAEISFSGPATATGLAIQGDGRIVVAGTRSNNGDKFALTRLNEDGSIDVSWGVGGKTAVSTTAGKVNDQALDVAIGADGTIYAAGADFDRLNDLSSAPESSRLALARFWRTEAPHAVTRPRTIRRGGDTGITFSVAYRDDGVISSPSLRSSVFGNRDVEIIDPDGVNIHSVVLVGRAQQSDGSWIVNYRFAAPGGSFDATDNGTYRIKLRSNQVSDSEGNFTIGRTLGTIGVSIAGAGTDTGAGTLDAGFNGTGVAITDTPAARERGRAVVPLKDGRVIVVGEFLSDDQSTDGFLLVRHNADGSYDNTFGENGVAKLPAPSSTRLKVFDAIVQPDGKILALATLRFGAGQYHILLARFTADGAFDTTFGANGLVEFDDESRGVLSYTPEDDPSFILLPDGKILVSVSMQEQATGILNRLLAMLRFNADGSLDETFANQGMRTLGWPSDPHTVTKVLSTGDGGAVVVARTKLLNRLTLVKFNADGSLAPGFGFNPVAGIAAFDMTSDEAVTALMNPDGSIVVAGVTPNDGAIRLSKFTPAGQRDTSFGSSGVLDIAFGGRVLPTSITRQGDGRIVVAGWRLPQSTVTDTIVSARIFAAGALDTAWGGLGRATPMLSRDGSFEMVNDLAIGADGSIYLAGHSVAYPAGERLALARLRRNAT